MSDGKKGRSTLMYASDKRGYKEGFDSFMHTPKVAILFGLRKEDVFQVVVRDLRDGESSPFWAWWSNEKQAFLPGFVWPHEGGVEMCFPYGTRVLIEKGEGEKVNVMVGRAPA
jgi:hypothetical protein